MKDQKRIEEYYSNLIYRCGILDFIVQKAQQDLNRKQAMLRDIRLPPWAELPIEFSSEAHGSEVFSSLRCLFPQADRGVVFTLSKILQSESLTISSREVLCSDIAVYHEHMEKVINEAKKSPCNVLKVGTGIWDKAAEQFIILTHNGGLDDKFECNWEMHEFEMECSHAEQNAFAIASSLGLRIYGMSMLSTDSPCYSCAQSIRLAGIGEVLFIRNHMDPFGIFHLLLHNVRAKQLLQTTIREFILLPIGDVSRKGYE